MNDLSRDVGQLDGRVGSVEDRLGRIEEKLDRLVVELAGMSGGRKTLIGLLTLAASLGAAAAELLHWAHSR